MAYGSDVITETSAVRLEDIDPELLMRDFAAFHRTVADPANRGKTYERVCAELNIPPAMLGIESNPIDPPPRVGASMTAIRRNYLRSRGVEV